ncbi:dimethylarginine dimethylaminohydrolase family protein [Halobacillus salinus]|nr:arginine deiminase family protein [Halobacillus salinus]
MKDAIERKTIHCTSEYGTLKSVIVAPPTFMRIESIMNETQKHFKNENIDQQRATEQHNIFTETLQKNGAEVIELPANPELNEQVFTRDIGFTIDDLLFIGAMDEPLRKQEPLLLKAWCEDYGIPFHESENGSIEGGDVLLDGERVWIGVSSRTTEQAIDALRSELPDKQIEGISLRDGVLHLDCALNILSDSWALIYPPAFSTADIKRIQSRFNLIPMTRAEYFNLGPNVLSIGNQTVISLKQNKRINQELANQGFHVIGIDFSEIIKSGGSFRCCSLPLHRGQ